jgi:hypothetical protein
VNATLAPSTKFVTFAETQTGIAYANPSTTDTAVVTLTVISSGGVRLGSKAVTVPPLGHGHGNIGPLLGLTSFTGIVEITSSIPILELSINAEVYTGAHQVFSSMTPGDLSSSTVLVTP